MNWAMTFKKGGLAVLTFAAAYLVANPQVLTHLIPENIAQMTVGSIVAALIVAVANWLKNKNEVAK